MKRRITVLVLLAALVLSTSHIPAYAEKAGEWGYEVLQDGTIHITEYRGQAEHVVVPEMIDGKRVTSLEKCGSEYTVSVELPKYLNHIGSFDPYYEEPIGPVFYGCPNLEHISVAEGNSSFCSVDGILMSKDQTEIVKCPQKKSDIDDSIFRKVQKIAPRAFASCKSLSQIHFSDIKEIGLAAFADCTNLTEVTGLEGITVLGSGAFENCTNLTAITGLEGITVLGGSTFEYCESLTTVTGLERVTEIGGAAFNHCKNLESISIPEGCTKIGEYAFYCCEKLDGIEIPESVTKIEQYAFADSGIRWVEFRGQNIQRFEDSLFAWCINLKSIVIPEGVKRIGEFAFYGSGIETLILPDSFISDGEGAFDNCPNLRTIRLGKNISSFGVPHNCPKLEAVEVSKENETYSSVDGVLMSKDGTELLGYPEGKSPYYIVPKTVTTIGEHAFYNRHLRGIELRSSIKNIKNPEAFTFYSLSMEDGTSNREMLPVVVRKGSYAETYAKENKLNYAVAPGIRSVSAKKGSATVGWNSFAWADAYQIRYSYQEDMSGAKKFKAAADKTSAAIKNLSSGKTCYIQIRAVMEDPDTGAKYYTAWSAKKKVTIP